MLTVTKIFHFEAAHSLPDYKGACHNLHGHSYKLEVTVGGRVQVQGEKKGMIIDFKDLKSIVHNFILNKLDHSNLNEMFDNPTAEDMVRYIGNTLYPVFKNESLELVRVRLWETSDSYAEYIPEFDRNLGNYYMPL